MYFFTADYHLGHRNIIDYCNRPFGSVKEMDDEIIKRNNEIVSPNDFVIHAGDFTMKGKNEAQEYLKRLNGNFIFLEGDHDYWLNGKARQIWKKSIEGQNLVVCHYCMRTWPKSHYNSWHFYAHSHARLEPIGKSWDIGVDNSNFYPNSFSKLKEIMYTRPDNPNFSKLLLRKG